MENELRQLLVAPRAVAEKALAESLRGLIAIVEDTGEIMLTRAFESLDVTRKVITYLLGLRAAVILENRTRGHSQRRGDCVALTSRSAENKGNAVAAKA